MLMNQIFINNLLKSVIFFGIEIAKSDWILHSGDKQAKVILSSDLTHSFFLKRSTNFMMQYK